MKAIDMDFEALFSNEVQKSHEMLDYDTSKSGLRRPDLEKHLEIQHAKIMALYKKDLEDYPQNPCCSCNMLFRRKQGTKVCFSDELGRVWPKLKEFILKDDPQASNKTFVNV